MTGFSLIPLSAAAGPAFEMLRDLPSEAGYTNPAFGLERAEYLAWAERDGQSDPDGENGGIPSRSYLLFHEGAPVPLAG